VGLFAGYKGEPVAQILRSITDLMLVIPSFLILVIVGSYLRGINVSLFTMILALFMWPGQARIMMNQVLSMKEMPFVNLAKVSDQSDKEIIFKEILPNILPYVGVVFIGSFVGGIMTETALQIIGVFSGTTTTLGSVLSTALGAQVLYLGVWWWIFPPVVVLVLTFVTLHLINMSLDEMFNPRLRKITYG
jgi:peptide/nickel transport system permease protein